MLVYIASPYSSEFTESFENLMHREERVDRVEEYIAKLYADGNNKTVMFYSPILHCHEMAQHYSLPTGHEFWESMDHIMIDKSDRVEVLMMEGWKESKGVQDEIAYANLTGKPISYINWQ